jgi:hypothetical protein
MELMQIDILKQMVLSRLLNVIEVNMSRKSEGGAFQVAGPAYEKAR